MTKEEIKELQDRGWFHGIFTRDVNGKYVCITFPPVEKPHTLERGIDDDWLQGLELLSDPVNELLEHGFDEITITKTGDVYSARGKTDTKTYAGDLHPNYTLFEAKSCCLEDVYKSLESQLKSLTAKWK